MAFTNNCSLFAAIDEEGINRIVRHIMRQRPSLFNYGTAFLRDHPEYLCERIDVHPWVTARGNPIITVEDPLPIIGTDGSLGLNFCFQLTRAEIDFHPGSVFDLPPQLRPLNEQRFAFHVRVCGGLGCASREFFDRLKPREALPEREFRKAMLRNSQNAFQGSSERFVGMDSAAVAYADTRYTKDDREFKEEEPKPKLPPRPIPFDKLDCFCLDLFAVGHFELTGAVGNQRLVGKLDGLEIVDIQPEGLENSIECYLKLLIHMVILPRLSIALEVLVFEILDGNATITLAATPISATVPHNPAIEDNKLKIFVNMEAS
ncbi:MAG TPA: hypothetical protein VJV03_09025 [Pyrinomonadaceae bacterium]|nr:hypothetical protein [Pyrinomonadaceae bacterium]